MGYDTSFEGAFTFNRELDDKSYETLRGLANVAACDAEGQAIRRAWRRWRIVPQG